MTKSRASSTEDARWYRQRGHNDAREFAFAIGLPRDYENDPQAKSATNGPAAMFKISRILSLVAR